MQAVPLNSKKSKSRSPAIKRTTKPLTPFRFVVLLALGGLLLARVASNFRVPKAVRFFERVQSYIDSRLTSFIWPAMEENYDQLVMFGDS